MTEEVSPLRVIVHCFSAKKKVQEVFPSSQTSCVALLLGFYLLGSDTLVLFLKSPWSALPHLYNSYVQEV